MNVRKTPAVEPSVIEKTLAFNDAHTSERLNHQVDRLVGANQVLSGLRVRQDGEGLVTLLAGAFVVDGVIVDVKSPIAMSYVELLTDGKLPRATLDRKRSIILWAFCGNSSRFDAVIFGFATDANQASVTGDGYVHIAVLHPLDETSEDEEDGHWTHVFGISNEELARDTREGVQTIESISFASETGVLRTNPDFSTKPYFTHDHQLLVFADRFLIPSAKVFSDTAIPYFFRKGITGFKEQNVDPTAFDFGNLMAVEYNLTLASWGVVISRDIEWQEVFNVAIAPAFLTLSTPVVASDPKLLAFRNGVYIPMSDLSLDVGGTELSISGGIEADSLYHVVKLKDFVFEIEVPLAGPITVPANVDIEIPSYLYDSSRHSLLVFLQIASGTDESDAGYIQINRRGTAARDSQGVKIAGGFSLLDSSHIRLRDVTIQAGVDCSVIILCLRGSTHQNFFSQDGSTAVPFYKKWKAVTGDTLPDENEIVAFPDLYGFVAAAPGASQSVQVALHSVGSDFVTLDGTVIGAGHFNGYRLEQGPTFESEVSVNKAPREITGSAAPVNGSLSGFSDTWTSVVMTVPLGAQAAIAGDPIRLVGGREIQDLPPYEIGADKLFVAINGVKLIMGVDCEEKTNTSIVIRRELKPGEYLEAWVV